MICKTINYSLFINKTAGFVRVRDLEGAKRCEPERAPRSFYCDGFNDPKRSAVKHGSEADPGKSPTAAGLGCGWGGAGTP